MKTIDFKVGTENIVKLYYWDEVNEPKGVVQIIHGMAEHSARYTKFAKFLNANGYLVYCNDLRGHGFNVVREELGWDEGDMWTNDLTDQLRLSEYINIQHPNLPLIVLGHSYGSFLAQAYLPLNRRAVAIIFSGSCYMKGGSIFFGRIMSNHLFRRHGNKVRAKLMYDLTFASYQNSFKGNGAWITSNEDEAEKYKKDFRCGYILTTNFYKYFFAGLKKLYKSDKKQANKQMPLYIFSGTDDAVGKMGKGVTKLYKYYTEKVGMQNVDFKLYDGGRHEMLNEVNREVVFADVLDFISKVLDKKV